MRTLLALCLIPALFLSHRADAQAPGKTPLSNPQRQIITCYSRVVVNTISKKHIGDGIFWPEEVVTGYVMKAVIDWSQEVGRAEILLVKKVRTNMVGSDKTIILGRKSQNVTLINTPYEESLRSIKDESKDELSLDMRSEFSDLEELKLSYFFKGQRFKFKWCTDSNNSEKNIGSKDDDDSAYY